MISGYGSIRPRCNSELFILDITIQGGFSVAFGMSIAQAIDFVVECSALLDKGEFESTEFEPGTSDVGEVFRRAFESEDC